MFKKIFGSAKPTRDMATHRLFRVPVTVTFDVFVAAPSAALAGSQAVVAASPVDFLSEVESLVKSESAGSVFQLGEAVPVLREADLPPTHRRSIPYAHPEFPLTHEPLCQDFLRGDGLPG